MSTNLSGNTYVFCKSFQHNEKQRLAFDHLAQKTFGGLSFESWYKQGYWNDGCVPYALFDGDKVVSGLLATHFNFTIKGEQKRYVQLGTVMTDSAYRKQGLSRIIMEKVLEDCQGSCDGVILLANDSVLDFYPKFGFIAESEYRFSTPISPKTGRVEKLDMKNSAHKALLVDKIKHSNPYSLIRMTDSSGIPMFHCTMFLSDCIYYLPDYDAVAVAEHEGGTLLLMDVFCDGNQPLADIISILAQPDTTRATLGFTPEDTHGFTVSLSQEENTTLFVLKGKDNLFSKHQAMFPLLCRT